jgi:DNA-binding transcriptional ArsR family regulator
MSFLKIEHKFFRTKEYLNFLRKPEMATYYFLRSAIIRNSKEVQIGGGNAKYIYYNYFNNGKLVSRYPQKLIGEYMGIKQPSVSKHILYLVKNGFIKVHERKVKDGVAKYYEFGKWEGEWDSNSYKEIYYLDEYFIEIYKKEKEERDFNKYEIEYLSDAEMFDTVEGYVYNKMREKGEPLTIEEIEFFEAEWGACH